jgi:aspartate carbamoyltransferase catalytic subunit
MNIMTKKRKDLITIRELSVDEINAILDRGDYWADEDNFRISNNARVIDNPIVCNIFFESSTRTRFSFEVAAKKLGYHILNFDPNHSSTTKGETVYDTLRTLESMGVNCAIIRTKEENMLQEVAPQLDLAVVNAGAGAFEHPTQGLLDLLTIRQHFGRIENLKVAIIGDVRYSRVANSNIVALGKYGTEVLIAGPEELLPKDGAKSLGEHCSLRTVDEAVEEADVVMMLRVQRERHPRKDDFDWDTSEGRLQYLERYGLTVDRFRRMNEHAIIMHPAPFNRDVEIDGSLVEHSHSMIYKQVKNGVAIRMAVLERALS